MRAAVYKQPNEMAVIDVPRPVAGPGEVVLKVHDCGICGSDLHCRAVRLRDAARRGDGHEFSGEIVELGPQVSGYAVGDRVTSLLTSDATPCATVRCGKGDALREHPRPWSGATPGAYAEYAMCGAKSLFKLPDSVSSQLGALVEPLSVGLHGVNRSGLRPARRAW